MESSSSSQANSPVSEEGPSKLLKMKAATTCIVFPCLLIALDMFYSDTVVMYRILNYLITVFVENNYSIVSNATTQSLASPYHDSSFMMICLSALVGLLVYIYLLSLVGILSSHVFSCLRTNYTTGLLMADAAQEKLSTPILLDSVTRYDLSINESGSESAWQSCLQWSIYLVLQLLVGTKEVGEELSLTFNSLYISGLLSTLSLTMAQIKANKLLTEFQSTVAQQGVYFVASLASTLSGQLLTILGIVTIADAGMTIMIIAREYLGAESGLVAPVGITLVLLGFYGLTAILTLLTVKRLSATVKMFQQSSILTITTEVEHCWTKIGQLGLRWLTLQPLHLQTSKTRILTKKKIFYPGLQSEKYFFKENLLIFILISFTCVILFISNNTLIYTHMYSTQKLPYSSHISPARSNFLLICSILIPGGWIIAQLGIKLFYHLDLGLLTCGATFKFDNPEEINDNIEHRRPADYEDSAGLDVALIECEVEGNPTDNTAIQQNLATVGDDDNNVSTPGLFGKLDILCKTGKVVFLSETGRWIEDDNDESTGDEPKDMISVTADAIQ